MFAYEELKKRLPESEEVMNGEEALNYFRDKSKPRKEARWYTLVVNDIYFSTSFSKGAVLDVGCGSAGLLKEFQSSNPELELVGIDGSKTLIDNAHKFIASKKIKLFYSDAGKLKFKDSSFDLVVCQDTFHHFRNPVKVLKEMYRVVKKGGFIYMTDLRRDVEKGFIEQAIRNISKKSIDHTRFYLASLKAAYTVSEMKQIIKKSGIKKCKVANGKNERHTMKIIKTILNPETRIDKERLFKERWVAIIKK
ncbi:MAG: class I SAM-dependent methyltransferase [archaeon]